ncbi:unnamed protein product [Blepharisma stoltei]|uniref:PAS domain-containing protein n=1 Tax=Blepharisma stoltei TaxID=1481888 RepID=A0AAU9J8R9_9CILI|nr:unnamed protein product [Blepharisma stoltei]
MNFNKNIKAKSSTSLDLQRQSFFIFMCASYVCFDSKYAIYHQLICFLLSFLLEIKTIWSLQYFNCIENTIQACKMGSISLTLLIFIFGELLDNSLLILVFTLIFQPILLFYLIFYTLKSYKNTKDYDNSSRNQFDFERKYRLLLINPNPDNKYQILKLFDKQWKMIHFKKNKLFVIWEFNFCIYILNDERLARVKLTKLALCENSFEGNFQEWKVLNWLKNSEGREFPEIKYLEFLQKFGKLKERDEELCYLIIKLQTEFASRAPRIRWLEKLSTKTAKIMQKVNEGYKIDTEKYKNTETVSLYASFLKNILKNYNDSILLEKKRSQIDYTLRKDYYLEKYGSQIGILLISCEQNSFGNIIYLNDMASEILKLSMNEICGNSIFSFIPSSYRISHEKLMKKFVNDSKSVQIPCHNYLFFESQYGFLIECDALIKLTAFYNNCFYLISFNQKQAPRQFALISEEGIIIGHSELFSNCLGCNFQCIKNKNISEIFPFIGMNKLTENLPWVETIKGKDIGLIYIKKIIREEILNVLYVIDNESEIKKIENFNDSCNVKISFTFEQNEDCPQINEIPHENKSEAKKLQILFENVEETSHIECDTDFTQQNQIFSDNKICNPSSLTRSSIYLEQLKNLIFKSKQKIATLKCVLFIVVKNI